MTLDIFVLQSFIVLAETGSFTKAAKVMNRTQPAISQHIARLESMCGRPLFFRGKELSLTSDGEILLSYARKIVSLNHQVMDHFNLPTIKGEVTFGLPDDFASVFLSDVLADFTRLHPSVLLNVTCDFTVNLFNRFKAKELDLVLVKMNRPGDFPNGVTIWSEPLYWVGDPNIIDLGKLPVPLVLSPQPCVYRDNAINALQTAGITWRMVFNSHSYAGIISAVQAGMGITVLPRTMIPESLRIINCAKMPTLNDTHVSLLKHHADSDAINSFETFVLKKIKH